jgi:predicted unusual protein kinase regulating ubiquinone biosynthesis (AarF/ABC1/UbiB family)
MSVSSIYIIKIMITLLPTILNFRKDRRDWVKREGKGVDEKKYKKHAEKALKAFITLGPSYIKLGQWLSTRADFLPQPYLEVLANLQDNVPPAPFEQVKPIIESELGKIETIYESFNTSAISGASLGQVYLARYNGNEVIVKVSRPNIEQTIEKDIDVLKKILPLAARFVDPNLAFSAEGILSQFIETIHEEIDYRLEAQNLMTIKQNLGNNHRVIIPNVFMERTSKHVITMDYIPGIKITDIAQLESVGIDRGNLVARIHRIFFKMLLSHKIFHADPHPGNLSVANDGSIILYDYGMVGRLDNETRLRLIRLYRGLIESDHRRVVDILLELGTLEPTVNRYYVERALELSLQSLHGKQVDQMEVNALMNLANKTMSKFPFRLPKNLALYLRMTSILEGIYKYHGIEFQFLKVLRNLLEEEGLIQEAYIAEMKYSLQRLRMWVEDSVSLTPLLKSYLERDRDTGVSNSNRRYDFLALSIFASVLFIGSSIMLPQNPLLAYCGFILSGVTIVGATLKRKFTR